MLTPLARTDRRDAWCGAAGTITGRGIHIVAARCCRAAQRRQRLNSAHAFGHAQRSHLRCRALRARPYEDPPDVRCDGHVGGGWWRTATISPRTTDAPRSSRSSAVKDIEHALEHDAVGRPSDKRVLSTALERDERGASVVRGEIVAVSPTAADMAVAQRLHFTVLHQDKLEALGISSVTLRVPEGMSAVQALAALRSADASGSLLITHMCIPLPVMVPAAPHQASRRCPFARAA